MKHHKPNTVNNPTIFYDYWMPRTTNAEFKILMCICRKTYGWHKLSDKISIKQIMKATSNSKTGILKCIELLIQKGIILKIRSKTSDGDDAPNEYTINCELEIDDYIEEEGGVHSVGGGSTLSVPRVVHSVYPQKKDLTKERKENIKRKKSLSASLPTKKLQKPKEEMITFGKKVKLPKQEYNDLVAEDGMEYVNEMFYKIDDHMASIGAKYIDFTATYRNWRRRDFNKSTGGEGMDDREYANKVRKEFNVKPNRKNNAKMECYASYVEISGEYSPHTTLINYIEKGFREQLDNAVRKWSLV